MSTIEIERRMDSLYHWIRNHIHSDNPHMNGIILYWLRLVKLLNTTMHNDNKVKIEEELTPEAIMEIEVVDPEIVEP